MKVSRLSIVELHKSYSVPVLKGISLSVAPGEVHALVGENGAGKSTLVNILTGVLQSDAGGLKLDGENYVPANPQAALAAGISCVPQELSTIATLSVAENISLTNLPHRRFVIARDRLASVARQMARRVGLDHSPQTLAEHLSLADRQLLELAKALSVDARLLILDEPTAALAAPQARRLHEIIRGLSARGTSVIYISHRLGDVLAVADTVTVLRDGRVVVSASAKNMSIAELTQQMSGKSDVVRTNFRPSQETLTPLLEVRNLQTDALPHGISFDCNAGEIIGIAGLAGAGRSELLQTMFGLAPLRGGCIQRRRGQGRTPVINPRQAVAMGIAFLGEDRQAMGLFRGQSVLTNMMIPGKVSGTATIGLIDRDMEAAAGKEFVDRLAVGCDNLHQAIEQLSGGNQQKTLIARWLHCDSDIFLLDEPTRGVDVRTKNAIYELLFGIRDRGKSIIMASSEIDELMTVCDRILVLSARKLVQTFLAGNWSEQDILHAAFSELTAGNKYAGASLTGEAQA